MAVTIDTDGATTYFGETAHPQSTAWLSLSDDQQTALVAHAKLILTRGLGTEITSETTDINSSYRPDYAVFEQALFMALNSGGIVDGTQTGPKFLGDDGDGKPVKRDDWHRICEEAKRWMDWGVGASAVMMRG